MIHHWIKRVWLILFVGLTISCATYYQLNYEFNQFYTNGDLEAAGKLLDSNKKQAKDKNRFLYFLNQGLVNAQLGKYEESNEWFEKAYIFGEDYHKNAGAVTATFLVNPNTITYPGEDHEHILLLYYKAINYLHLSDYESALVECRRLNNRLYELADKYPGDNKYKRDAFVHNLMGIVYEASGDINNAFIAYRNSYDIYKDDYQKLFGLTVPDQLKEDLLRSAYLNGFTTELDYYEREFGRTYNKDSYATEELIFFWHNGLGPVKSEWSVNFTVIEGEGGMVSFVNEDMGFNFPFPLASDDQKSELTDLRFFRVAFPKYEERKVMFTNAYLLYNSEQYPLEMAENVNDIAFKVLNERMLKEFAQGLLRVAIKKSLEQAIRGDQRSDKDQSAEEKRNEEIREGLSFLVGIVNAATEKADTRNWQTLPHDIFYTRVPLDTGYNEVILQVSSELVGAKDMHTFNFEVRKGETVFHTFHSLEAL
ncbi:MAG: COG3014 family protein [Bacteroidota bacterium]